MGCRQGNQTTSEPQPVDFKEFYWCSSQTTNLSQLLS